MNAVVCSCTPRRARSAAGAVAGVEAEHRHGAGRGASQTLENLDERGLAGAVRAEQPDDLARSFDGEVDAAERPDSAVGLAQCAHVNGCHDGSIAHRQGGASVAVVSPAA
jgi:hypothetical protein